MAPPDRDRCYKSENPAVVYPPPTTESRISSGSVAHLCLLEVRPDSNNYSPSGAASRCARASPDCFSSTPGSSDWPARVATTPLTPRLLGCRSCCPRGGIVRSRAPVLYAVRGLFERAAWTFLRTPPYQGNMEQGSSCSRSFLSSLSLRISSARMYGTSGISDRPKLFLK